MARAVPEFLYPFLIKEEACVLRAYQDSKGVWTIGVGHTGPEVHKGLVIPQSKADEYLRKDVEVARARLAGVVTRDAIEAMTDHQYAALISFVFNLGANKTWGFWKTVNAKKWDEVPAYMMRFNKIVVMQNGKKVTKTLAGLTNRRTAEVKLWNTPDKAPARKKKDPAAPPVEVVEPTPPSSQVRASETPPTPIEGSKSLVQSKTFWSGATVAAMGATQGVTQVQGIAEPQAGHSNMVQQIVGFTAVAVVALGIAIMVFRWLDERSKRK